MFKSAGIMRIFLIAFTPNSIAIVAMTRDNSTVANSSEVGDSIVEVGDGVYDWTIGQRGHLLSGFFYLYIITQIPGKFKHAFMYLINMPENSNSLQVQSCAEKRDCFAKHLPGVAGCGWLQPGRNFLST